MSLVASTRAFIATSGSYVPMLDSLPGLGKVLAGALPASPPRCGYPESPTWTLVCWGRYVVVFVHPKLRPGPGLQLYGCAGGALCKIFRENKSAPGGTQAHVHGSMSHATWQPTPSKIPRDLFERSAISWIIGQDFRPVDPPVLRSQRLKAARLTFHQRSELK